ncbi:MAG: preprotein translocase subunit SecG [Bacteroidota bacterium]
MYIFFIAIEIIVSILLIGVILMQNSKGGGLAGAFGGGNFGTVFGVRRTADFLTRATTILATTFMVLALLINLFFLPGKNASSRESIIQSGQTSVPPAQLPPQTQPLPSNTAPK